MFAYTYCTWLLSKNLRIQSQKGQSQQEIDSTQDYCANLNDSTPLSKSY